MLILGLAWALSTKRTDLSTHWGLSACVAGSGAAYRATSAHPTLGNAGFSLVLFGISTPWLKKLVEAIRSGPSTRD